MFSMSRQRTITVTIFSYRDHQINAQRLIVIYIAMLVRTFYSSVKPTLLVYKLISTEVDDLLVGISERSYS